MGALRTILALLVVCSHLRPLPGLFATVVVTGGAVFAVKAFFLISGFYMAMVLNEQYRGRPLHDFYISRLSRLLPLYWVVAVAALIVELQFVPRGHFFSPLASPLAYGAEVNFHALPWTTWVYIAVAELTTFGMDTGQWLGFSKLTGAFGVSPDFVPDATSVMALSPVPPAWSIGLEMTFYLIAPFIVRQRMRVIAALMIASLGFRCGLAYLGHSGDPWNRSLFPSELIYFLLGVVSFRIYLARPKVSLELRRMLSFFPIMITVFISPAFNAAQILSRHYHLISPDLFFDVTPYVFLAIGLPFLFERTERSQFDLQIGNLSYPIYISHIFVMGLLQLAIPLDSLPIGAGWLWLLWNVAWVCVVALALDRLVAAPIDEWRKRFGARAGKKSAGRSMTTHLPFASLNH